MTEQGKEEFTPTHYSLLTTHYPLLPLCDAYATAKGNFSAG
jgi:hypothetical protein